MSRFTNHTDGIPGPQGPAGEDGIGIPAGGTVGDILAKIDGTDFNTEWIQNYTSTVKHVVRYIGDGTIAIGTPVYTSLNGNSSTNIPVKVASNDSEATSSKTMGLMESSVSKNGTAFVVTEGLVSGINTSSANTGDAVWLGVNGGYIFGLANKPKAPSHLVFLGVVTRGQHVNGEIFVKVQNGFEIEELHNVKIDNPQDGQVLKYQASTGMWINSNP